MVLYTASHLSVVMDDSSWLIRRCRVDQHVGIVGMPIDSLSPHRHHQTEWMLLLRSVQSSIDCHGFFWIDLNRSLLLHRCSRRSMVLRSFKVIRFSSSRMGSSRMGSSFMRSSTLRAVIDAVTVLLLHGDGSFSVVLLRAHRSHSIDVSSSSPAWSRFIR